MKISRRSTRRRSVHRSRAYQHSRNGSRPGHRARVRGGIKATRRRVRISAAARKVAAQILAEKRRLEAQYLASLKSFEAATRYTQKQNYERAKEIFEKLAEGPIAEVSERARMHLRLCEQKLQAAAPSAKTAEDYYNYGVAELNARRLESAIERLSKADRLAPNQEHVRYALAAAYALQSHVNLALENLKAAIALRPENRFQARHDEDFASLAGDPRFKHLLNPRDSEAF